MFFEKIIWLILHFRHQFPLFPSMWCPLFPKGRLGILQMAASWLSRCRSSFPCHDSCSGRSQPYDHCGFCRWLWSTDGLHLWWVQLSLNRPLVIVSLWSFDSRSNGYEGHPILTYDCSLMDHKFWCFFNLVIFFGIAIFFLHCQLVFFSLFFVVCDWFNSSVPKIFPLPMYQPTTKTHV